MEAVAEELVGGVMDEVWHGGEKAVTRLTPELAEQWRAANDTRVVARLRRPESIKAFVQACHARPARRARHTLRAAARLTGLVDWPG